MDERVCFIAAHLRGEEPMSALCERYGISRKTGYKWLARYDSDGCAGLRNRSSARASHANAIDGETAALILGLRASRPSWGPRKLLARLDVVHPGRSWPAASTVGDLLRREGLCRPRRRPAREPASAGPLFEPSAPNETWSADFKGWFRTGDGLRCEPLTVVDGYCRYILLCQAMTLISGQALRPVLTALFRDNGLPRALRTDNGSPFAHRLGLGGLSRLSVWLLTLDIWPDRITPGRPDQNGRHERMHRTLNEDVAQPPAPTLAEQQARMDAWRHDFNTIRPHEALGQRCPAALYQPSVRAFPERIAAWEYPADHHVRRVDAQGYVKWRDTRLYLSEALRGETIGLAQRDDGDWAVRFRAFDLAVLGDASGAIRRSGLVRTPVPGRDAAPAMNDGGT
jgi:transposase InsO family protein